MRWLVISLVLSVVLTVVLNVGLRVFPELGDRLARGLAGLTRPSADERGAKGRRIQVYVPWKAMILVSVVLTIVVNLVRWMA